MSKSVPDKPELESLLARLEESASRRRRLLDFQKHESSRIRRVMQYCALGIRPYLLRLLYRYAPWLPVPSVEVTLFTGQKLYLPFTDSCTHELNRYGSETADCEVRLAKHYMRSLSAKSVFFDIGANFGYFSAIGVHFSAHVCAFEANSELCRYLSKNFDRDFVDVVNAMVGEEHGRTAWFYLVAGHADRATRHDDIAAELSRDKMTVSKVETFTTSVDHHIEQTGYIPTHVKIDVEGGEYGVLLGMTNVLRTYSPEVVMEMWGGEKFEISRIAGDHLVSLGYRPFVITHTGIRESSIEEVSRMAESRDNILFEKI